VNEAAVQPADLELDTMLLATDWSEDAERLHAQAAAIAKLFGAQVVVVTAFNPPGPLRIRRGAPGLDAYRKELEEEAKHTAAEVTAELIAWGVSARAVAAEGSPADVILQTAREESAGLIVLGGGSGGSARYLMGSTAERVVRHAEVPVYVFRWSPAGSRVLLFHGSGTDGALLLTGAAASGAATTRKQERWRRDPSPASPATGGGSAREDLVTQPDEACRGHPSRHLADRGHRPSHVFL
jgi:nucleotide-binding universal stress UspA family protein